jgi:hypothetical protein
MALRPRAGYIPTRPDMPTVAGGEIVCDPLLLERYEPEVLTDLMMFDPAMSAFHVGRAFGHGLRTGRTR